MHQKVNLQIPISSTLKEQADRVAKEQGFSSLQEVVRVFIANYSKEKVSISFGNTVNPQTLAAYEKELEETKKAIDRGDIKVHETPDGAIDHLSKL